MLRKSAFIAFVALLVALALSSKAHPWGGYHVGYTHYSPYTGFHHYGYTGVYRGYGDYRYGGYRGLTGYHYGGTFYGGYPYYYSYPYYSYPH